MKDYNVDKFFNDKPKTAPFPNDFFENNDLSSDGKEFDIDDENLADSDIVNALSENFNLSNNQNTINLKPPVNPQTNKAIFANRTPQNTISEKLKEEMTNNIFDGEEPESDEEPSYTNNRQVTNQEYKKTNAEFEKFNMPSKQINVDNLPIKFLPFIQKLKKLNFDISEAKKFFAFNNNSLNKLNAIFSFIETMPSHLILLKKIETALSAINENSKSVNDALNKCLLEEKSVGLKINSNKIDKISTVINFVSFGFYKYDLPPEIKKANLINSKNGINCFCSVADSHTIYASNFEAIIITCIKHSKISFNKWFSIYDLIGFCYIGNEIYFVYLIFSSTKDKKTPYFLLIKTT